MSKAKTDSNFLLGVAHEIANSIKAARQEWIDAPKCSSQENKELARAALIAIRSLANEVPGESDSNTPLGKWRADYLDLVQRCETKSEFLAGFEKLTKSIEGSIKDQDSEFFLHYASENALLAADENVGRKFRMSSLHMAGMAIGALATLINPDVFASRLKSAASNKGQQMANIRHKDNRKDKAHVNCWAATNAHLHVHKKGAHKGKPNLNEMATQIDETNQVSSPRSTIRRWLTDWSKQSSVA